jgi:hypothetical protein
MHSANWRVMRLRFRLCGAFLDIHGAAKGFFAALQNDKLYL